MRYQPEPFNDHVRFEMEWGGHILLVFIRDEVVDDDAGRILCRSACAAYVAEHLDQYSEEAADLAATSGSDTRTVVIERGYATI